MNAKETTLPSLADDPQYASAAAKLIELQVDLATLETRNDAALAELNSIASNPTPRGDAVDSAARRLLGMDDGASPAGRAGQLREALAEMFEKKQVLQAAIRLQRKELATQREKVSRTCIARVAPAHRELVRRIVGCIKELDLAQQAEHDLREALSLRDIALGDLRAMPVPKLGRLADDSSRLSAYLIECFEYGFIAMDELPKHLHELARAKTAKPMRPAKAVARVVDPADWLSV